MSSTNPASAGNARAVWTAAAELLLLPTVILLVNYALDQANASSQEKLPVQFALTIAFGLLALPRALQRDARRAPGPRPARAGAVTVMLAVVLAAAVLSLIDLLATWVGLGSLGYLSGKLPGDGDATAIRLSVAARGLSLTLGAAFLVSVAVGHRLRARARPAMTAAVLAFTVGVMLTNQLLAEHWGEDPVAEDRYLPVITGALCWIACRVGLRYAARTQDLYDALYDVRGRARNSAGPQ